MKRTIHKRKNRKIIKIKICVFACVMLFFAVIALMIPLRPKESQIENRTLTKFPKPTFETFWNGEFFEGVNTWYADTFPMRDQLISGNMVCRSAYGIQKNQIYGSVQAADGGTAGAEASGQEAVNKETQVQEKDDKTLKEGEKQREVKQIQEQFGGVYVADDMAFSLYGFNQPAVDRYIAVVNTLADKVDKEVNVYDMVVPISTGVYLDKHLQKELGCSDEKEAIQYVRDGLDDRVQMVDVFATLEDHNDEYLYFRTDHHWTALGAYYAYCEYMEMKDQEPTPIDEYETMTFEHFLGTLYSYCNQSAKLGANPDTVVAYIPLSTNEMQFTDKNGSTTDYDIITDVETWADSSKYNCFIGGDQPIAWIHNPRLSDGTSCLLVKESFGNAFAPFLVDHYEYVYIVDYRYYPSGLPALIEQKQIQDVIFLNNISAASTDSLVSCLEEIVNY